MISARSSAVSLRGSVWVLWRLRRLVAVAAAVSCNRTPGNDAGSTQPVDRWVEVRSGTVLIGCPSSEPCRDADEDQLQVKIERGFSIQAHEVTQAAFERALGYNPSFRRNCATCPVDSVTYDEASAFCNALSSDAQLERCYECQGREAQTTCRERKQPLSSCAGYRLPSEGEWEYAARAGTRTSLHVGQIEVCMTTCEICSAVAWYKITSKGRSQPVGKKAPNSWGLYDMHGNVYEWTSSWHSSLRAAEPAAKDSGKTRRVERGGSWYHYPEHLRSANRMALRPRQRLSYIGF